MSKNATAHLALVVFIGLVETQAFAGERVTASSAFATLKSLAGRWEGTVGTPDGPPGAVEYRVTSQGHTILEVLFPGTNDEMVTAYYVVGEDLVATHYCSMGNQPQLKLDRDNSSASELRFAFDGGTNFNPAIDTHMHSGTVRILGERLESEWIGFAQGKEEGAARFLLARAKP
jgi:hypothetical protein